MTYKLDYKTYLDKVYGAWYGKCLGGSAGATLEGKKDTSFVKDFAEYFDATIPNDDLDIQLLWLEALENYGANLTQEQMAEYWLKQCWYPMAEYGCFLRNYEMGIHPPVTGIYNNADFDEDMGCPIRSDIWGLAFPANPDMAVKFARYDASLDHSDESIFAEQYLSALTSLAFVSNSTNELFDLAEPYLAKGSRFAKMINMIFDECKVCDDYIKSPEILRLYGHYGFSSALQNVGFAIMALILGKGDMRKTINMALRCGYDTDCSCASAAAILGAMLGYKAIPDELKDFVKDKFICGIDVKRRSDSVYDLSVDTCALGVALAKNGNDKVEFTNVPEGIKLPEFKTVVNDFEFTVSYDGEPCIEPNGTKNININIKNNTNADFCGTLKLQIPDCFVCDTDYDVCFKAGESRDIKITVRCKDVKILANKNIIAAGLLNASGESVYTYSFGLCGASLYKMYGPYFDTFIPGKYKDKEPCDYEAAFNNDVDLDKDYLADGDEYVELYCSTCMLDAEKLIETKGQMCCYLKTNIICPEDRDIWFQVGNNDGFTVTLNGEEILKRDEIRMYSPYNNYVATKLKKGKNTLCFKLLRRTDMLKVGFRIKTNDGKHWNLCRWCSDLVYDIT